LNSFCSPEAFTFVMDTVICLKCTDNGTNIEMCQMHLIL
jgi:hypothetical protein